MLILLFAFAAGVVTVLAPCILPVLPIVLSGGAVQGRRRPWGIILGVVLSFSVFTLALSWAVQQLGLSPNFSRNFGITVLAALGLLFLIPDAMTRFESWMSARFSRSGQPTQRHGFGGGFLLGLSLGAVWTPCAGPVLAGVVAAAQTQQIDGRLVGITVAYAIGAALPMGLIAALGQRIVARVRWLSQRLNRVQQIFGLVLILVSLLMASNVDRRIQAWIIERTPNWLPQLQQFEEGINMAEASNDKKSPASELAGITGWINHEPITIAALRGKVVLVKFWTYTCINCIRTLPYVQSWYDKYHDQGFEIVAVHTPEFEFEKVPANVEKAVKDFSITYPVALDPDYKTWQAYENRYWPAKYLLDAQGNIRYVHFGEGEYDETELVIQQLLREAGQTVTEDLVAAPGTPFRTGQTPETYFGLARAQRFGSAEPLIPGQGTYSANQDLQADSWALEGGWTVNEESVLAEAGSALTMQVQSKDVYVVLNASGDADWPVHVVADGVGILQATVSGQAGDQALYRVASFPEFGEHRIRLEFPQGGVRVYAATFGSGIVPGLACGTDGKCNVTPI
jgi:cytochrome c biogenesis protein CcdA/thiol-disulfide isomerase/thioredoxin